VIPKNPGQPYRPAVGVDRNHDQVRLFDPRETDARERAAQIEKYVVVGRLKTQYGPLDMHKEQLVASVGIRRAGGAARIPAEAATRNCRGIPGAPPACVRAPLRGRYARFGFSPKFFSASSTLYPYRLSYRTTPGRDSASGFASHRVDQLHPTCLREDCRTPVGSMRGQRTSQYLQGGYGSRDMGAMMAMLVLAIIPIVVFYLFLQRYIIEGVVAGAVKG
jgi:hypothetical protein